MDLAYLYHDIEIVRPVEFRLGRCMVDYGAIFLEAILFALTKASAKYLFQYINYNI